MYTYPVAIRGIARVWVQIIFLVGLVRIFKRLHEIKADVGQQMTDIGQVLSSIEQFVFTNVIFCL